VGRETAGEGFQAAFALTDSDSFSRLSELSSDGISMRNPPVTDHREHSSSVTFEQIIDEIRKRGDPKAVAGMAHFGIQTNKAFGVSIPQLRDLSKKIRTNHDLARNLWKTGIHEARILASMIDDPSKVSENQMEQWAADFDSWDVVDGCCGNLFDKTEFAIRKAREWSIIKEEYVKRAGFVLMAELAVHDKKALNKTFLDFLPVIVKESSDERNFVKNAVSWALRQIGKRNGVLNSAAIKTCAEIRNSDSDRRNGLPLMPFANSQAILSEKNLRARRHSQRDGII
jgi:3-methyladenine DNA glycosylase AlkD